MKPKVARRICQTCKSRVKYNRRSACTHSLNPWRKGSDPTVGCLDKACEYYEWRGFFEYWEFDDRKLIPKYKKLGLIR